MKTKNSFTEYLSMKSLTQQKLLQFTEPLKLKSMVIKYNKEVDSIYIEIAKAKVAESDQEKKTQLKI